MAKHIIDDVDVSVYKCKKDVLILSIGGKKYSYSSTEYTPRELEKKFLSIAKHSTGKALNWVKQNTQLVAGGKGMEPVTDSNQNLKKDNRMDISSYVSKESDKSEAGKDMLLNFFHGIQSEGWLNMPSLFADTYKKEVYALCIENKRDAIVKSSTFLNFKKKFPLIAKEIKAFEPNKDEIYYNAQIRKQLANLKSYFEGIRNSLHFSHERDVNLLLADIGATLLPLYTYKTLAKLLKSLKLSYEGLPKYIEDTDEPPREIFIDIVGYFS